jgi:hypothetical protein
MQLTKTHKIIISIIVIAILLGIYITLDKSKMANKTIDTIQFATTTDSTGKVNTQGVGSYKIEQVPISDTTSIPKPIPDLNRETITATGAIINPEAKAAAIEKIKLLQTQLKNNVRDLQSWLDLGIYQKMAGDYEGAILSWKYAGKLSPTNYISFANLGNIYAYFMKDNAQAETYYKEAISKGPTQSYLYTQLAEIYRDIFKDLNKARAIINQGLSKIPNDPNLLQLQTSLK